MRTFKFRVWAKTAKRYLRSYKNEGFIFDYSHSGCLSDTDLEEYGGWDLGSCIQNDNFVVQQFTGLKDSKGVDIYEGDIVKGLFLDTDAYHWEEVTLPVVWVDHNGGFNISSNTWDRLSIEVVGNIFENENTNS